MEKVILKSRQVLHDASARALRGKHGAECVEPQVRTLMDGGVVRAIEIVCACGETVTVQLDGAAPSRPDDTGAQA